MIIHYFKIALRKLGKNYIFASINIGGLVIALASAFLIFHFILSELSTDHFHKNKRDIYRNILLINESSGEKMPFCSSAYILADNIQGKFPEIEHIARIHTHDHNYGGQYIIKEGNKIKATNFYITEASFFDIFSFKFLYRTENLLPDLNSIVISEKMAKKLFSNKNPLGKTLKIENTRETRHFKITGVFENIPVNSSIRADFFGHIELMKDFYESRGWWLSGTNTFYKLKKGSDSKKLEEKINAFVKPLLKPNRTYTTSLQRLTDIYFGSGHLAYYNKPMGDFKLILTYAIIGIIILLIASINYIIISTASSTERMVEIGVRKVMGAKRSTIIKQMIIESLLVTFIALPIAIILSEFTLPIFNSLIGKELELNYLSNWPYLIGIFLITLFISLISGSYISVFVSKFSPEQIFKKRFSNKTSKFNFRKILIITQVTSFMVLLSFSIVIIKQINYLLDKKVGYNAENLINVIPPHIHELYSCKAFKDALLRNPNIKMVSEVNAGLFSNVLYVTDISNIKNPNDKIEFHLLGADHDFFQTMQFDLVEGRLFDKTLSSDTACIILNKTGVKALNLKSPIDEVVENKYGQRFRVIGIVDDFHYKSMHSLVPPMGIILTRYQTMVDRVLVRVEPKNLSQTLNFIEETWKEYGPKSEFNYEFFENKISDQYSNDQRFSETIIVLTILIVLVATFGIFGFSFYNAKQRIKEIGIRKVYGASVTNIMRMIFKELGILIGISLLISVPTIYLICDNWLNNYAYQIVFPYWIFALIFIISISIVFLTTGITSYNAANRNPVDSLRYE